MSNRVPFQKPYTSAHDLVRLLQSRGLAITDAAKAESYLEYIGYYRLSAYMYPLLQMPKEQHRYKPGTSFDHKKRKKSNFQQNNLRNICPFQKNVVPLHH